MLRALAAVAAVASLGACQNYDFHRVPPRVAVVVNDPVQLTATPAAPDIMIVQDTSGSMCESIGLTDSSGNPCLSQSGSGLDPGYCSFCQQGDTSPVANAADCSLSGSTVGACATKMQLTSFAMNGALSSLGVQPKQAYIGLLAFPSASNSCAAGAVVVPVGDATQTIPQIESFYSGIANSPNGGTPTAASLQAVTGDATMSSPGATKYALLITDGLPNCNSDQSCATAPWTDGQVHGCASPSLLAAAGIDAQPPTGCSCSFGDCSDTSNSNICCPINPGGFPAGDYCLDSQGSVAAAQTLLSADGIETIVVGMGNDFTQAQFAVLDQIMAAGGTGFNGGKHYQANDAATLLAVLKTVIHQIVGNGCSYNLDQPVDPGAITVTLDDVEIPNDATNGWTFNPPNQIVLNGTYCTEIADGGLAGNLDITALAQTQ